MSKDKKLELSRLLDHNRRKFIALGLGSAALYALGGTLSAIAGTGAEWDAGQLAHIIPTANHERFLIKTSFQAPLNTTPQLLVNDDKIAGERTDEDGRFWRFDVQSLRPSTQYKLQIVDSNGKPLCGEWPLKTFPAPDAEPDRFRIFAYT